MEAFVALADPIRARVVELLAERDLTAGDIAARFRYPDYATLDDAPPALAAARRADSRFDAWMGNPPGYEWWPNTEVLPGAE